MKLKHLALVNLLQQAYSAEKAAAFAYQGHAGSVKNQDEKKAIRQIELDEWHHRTAVKAIMDFYEVPVSMFYEVRFYIIGKIISYSCYVIGRFMPFYFAGRLESGNVCEYFVMKRYFNDLGIHIHDSELYDMGMKEKEHEVYFGEQVKHSRLLPFFEKLFNWSAAKSSNDINIEHKLPVHQSDVYCRRETSNSQ
jgi:hypothetical protein